MPKSSPFKYDYLPALVKKCPSGYMVEYYVNDPLSGCMVRKRVRCQRLVKRYRTSRERHLAAQRVADEINTRLERGWSPLHETESSRLYTSISDLKDAFLRYKTKEGLRPATLRSYTSVTTMFVKWCDESGRGGLFSGTFLREDAVEYMDFVMDKGRGNRTYDNTLKVLRVLFSWALEKCYSKENPFAGIKPLPKERKKRILIPPDVRKRIDDYLQVTSPQMRLFVHLVYSSAMRPKEISMIQVKHIHLKEHYIDVPGENAKNRKSRRATISKSIEEQLWPVLADIEDGDMYLFGSNEGSWPDRRRVSLARMAKNWDKMRHVLGLPMEMQMYSLRDTGLVDLLHSGVDPLTVQHHADHSSLDVQRIYTDHADPGLVGRIYEAEVEF